MRAQSSNSSIGSALQSPESHLSDRERRKLGPPLRGFHGCAGAPLVTQVISPAQGGGETLLGS
jgi:hypothetical protein